MKERITTENARSAERALEVVAICNHLQNLSFSPTLPNSDQAVEMNVHIVRTFVRLREAATHPAEIERRMGFHQEGENEQVLGFPLLKECMNLPWQLHGKTLQGAIDEPRDRLIGRLEGCGGV